MDSQWACVAREAVALARNMVANSFVFTAALFSAVLAEVSRSQTLARLLTPRSCVTRSTLAAAVVRIACWVVGALTLHVTLLAPQSWLTLCTHISYRLVGYIMVYSREYLLEAKHTFYLLRLSLTRDGLTRVNVVTLIQNSSYHQKEQKW